MTTDVLTGVEFVDVVGLQPHGIHKIWQYSFGYKPVCV